MENSDLDLRQGIGVLWHGRYVILVVILLMVILSVVFSMVTYTPRYEAAVSIDLTPYDLYDQEKEHRPDDYTGYLTNIIRDAGVVSDIISGLGYTQKIPAESITIRRVGNTNLVRLEASGTDPGALNMALEQAGLASIQLARDHVFEQLLSEEKTLRQSLAFLEERIDILFGEEERPVYFYDNRGNVLDMDPAYRRLMEERGELLLKLNGILFEQKELEGSPAPGELLSVRVEAGHPVNPVRWELHIAAAVILGLLLSSFGVLARHHLSAGKTNVSAGE